MNGIRALRSIISASIAASIHITSRARAPTWWVSISAASTRSMRAKFRWSGWRDQNFPAEGNDCFGSRSPRAPFRFRYIVWRLSVQLVQGGEDCVAHFAGAGALLSRLHDVSGAQPRIQHAFHGALDQLRLFRVVERIAQAHRKGENAGERIGQSLAGNIGRGAVDRFV